MYDTIILRIYVEQLLEGSPRECGVLWKRAPELYSTSYRYFIVQNGG